jgi:tetratricopeptide (TPR) repeat protein
MPAIHKALLVAMLLTASCGPKTQLHAPAPVPAPAGPLEHEVLYRAGMDAFRLATPEGYQRAADAFRGASKLDTSNCEYSIRLAEALVFLAQEQKLNSEEFEPRVLEANALLDSADGSPTCAAVASSLNRLHGLVLYLREPLRRNDAAAIVNKAIELDPNDPLNWIALQRLTSRDPRNPLQHAMDLAPDLPLVEYEFGTAMLYVNDGFPKARQAFDRALERSPRHFEAIIGKVYSFSADEYSEETEPLLRRAVEIAPAFLTGRRLLGDYYAGMEEIEKAVEQYRAAIGYNARYYPAFLALGRTLTEAGSLNEAEQALNSLISLDVKTPRPPQNAIDYTADCQGHYYLGNIWLERGDQARAKAEYLLALSDIPNYTDAVYGMGIILYREGNVDGALARFNEVIKDKPDDYAGAWLARAGIRSSRGQFADALTDYNRAIGIFQQQIAALDAKAIMDESKGRQRKAEAERKRKAQLEAELQRALESRTAAK